jgi:uncharacterized protein (TIGR00369 family)
MSEADAAPARTVIKGSDYCFACGTANEHGLRLKITPIEDGCRTVFTPPRRFEGFHDIIHGGIVATVLDEVIAWACRLKGYNALTAELTVRYRKPMLVNVPVQAEARITREHGRLVFVESTIRSEAGEILATATAKMMR